MVDSRLWVVRGTAPISIHYSQFTIHNPRPSPRSGLRTPVSSDWLGIGNHASRDRN